MREAVRKNDVDSRDLALLEDRIALHQDKKQRYGSQIGMDEKTKKYYLLPLEDPENVDKRRAKMGLIPIADYLSRWQIDWNVRQSTSKAN